MSYRSSMLDQMNATEHHFDLELLQIVESMRFESLRLKNSGYERLNSMLAAPTYDTPRNVRKNLYAEPG
jgi:hypothetical protein